MEESTRNALNSVRRKINTIQELAGQGADEKKIRVMVGNAEFHLDGLIETLIEGEDEINSAVA